MSPSYGDSRRGLAMRCASGRAALTALLSGLVFAVAIVALRAANNTTPIYLINAFPDQNKPVATPTACVDRIGLGKWTDWLVWPEACSSLSRRYVRRCESARPSRRWQFDELATECGAKTFNSSEAIDLIKGGIAFAGDSMMRYMFVSLLQLANVTVPKFDRHADAVANLPDGTPLRFLWRPFPTDVVEQANRWANGTDPQPAVAVSSMCLWHMLWSHNAGEFALILERMDDPIQQILSQGHMRYILSTCTAVYPALMPNPRKSQVLTPKLRKEYNEALRGVYALAELPLLDLGELTQTCGSTCSIDGVHYSDVVNDVAVQILLSLVQLLRDSRP